MVGLAGDCCPVRRRASRFQSFFAHRLALDSVNYQAALASHSPSIVPHARYLDWKTSQDSPLASDKHTVLISVQSHFHCSDVHLAPAKSCVGCVCDLVWFVTLRDKEVLPKTFEMCYRWSAFHNRSCCFLLVCTVMQLVLHLGHERKMQRLICPGSVYTLVRCSLMLYSIEGNTGWKVLRRRAEIHPEWKPGTLFCSSFGSAACQLITVSSGW